MARGDAGEIIGGVPYPRTAYILFALARKRVDPLVFDCCVAVLSPEPERARAFASYVLQRPRSERKMVHRAGRERVRFKVIYPPPSSTLADTARALERAGVPLGEPVQLGEIDFARLPAWFVRELGERRGWLPRRRRGAVKIVPSPLQWPGYLDRRAEHVHIPYTDVSVYIFPRRIVISTLDYTVSLSRTAKPEELVFEAAAVLPERAIDELLRWRRELAEAVPELKPFLELASALLG